MARTSLSAGNISAGVETGMVTAKELVMYRQLLISVLVPPVAKAIYGTDGGGVTAAACFVVKRVTTAVNSCPVVTVCGRSIVNIPARL